MQRHKFLKEAAKAPEISLSILACKSIRKNWGLGTLKKKKKEKF
jgi:hypothetical protein